MSQGRNTLGRHGSNAEWYFSVGENGKGATHDNVFLSFCF